MATPTIQEPTTGNESVPAAIAALEKAVDRARSAGDEPALQDALLDLGRAYLEEGNAPPALTQFEEGIERATALGDNEAAARFWGYKGIALTHLGNTHFAQIALHKAHNLAREAESPLLVADTLMQLGSLYAKSGNSARAIGRYEQALAISVEAGDRLREMFAAAQAGALFFGMESLEKALEYTFTALHAAEALKRHHAACSYHIRLGQIFLADGAHDAAVAELEQALELATTLEEPAAELDALAALMRVYIAAGKTGLVTLYGENTIRLARERGNATAEIATIDLLTAYHLEREQFAKARPHLQRGLALAEERDDWSWQMKMHDRLGYIAYREGEEAIALDHYQQALQNARNLHDIATQAHLLGRIGAIHADSGAGDAAIAAAHEALALATESEDQTLVGEQHMLLAFAYDERGERAQATEQCRAAVAAFTTAGKATLREQAQTLLDALENERRP